MSVAWNRTEAVPRSRTQTQTESLTHRTGGLTVMSGNW